VIHTAAQVVGDIHHTEGTGASIRCRRGQRPPAEGVIEAQVGLIEETSAANVDHLQIRECQASLPHLEHWEVYFPQ
jgi:hypothetical protein